MGFGIPVGDRLRGPLRDWAESLLRPEVLTDAGLRPELVRRVGGRASGWMGKRRVAVDRSGVWGFVRPLE